MMNFFKKYKITLLTIVIFVVAFVVYQNYYVDVKNQELLVSINKETPGSVAGQDIIKLLNELQSIKFNTDIFSNDSFKNLIDFGQTVNPEVVGRDNPFAPIGVGGGSNNIASPVFNDNSIINLFEKDGEGSVE